MRSEREIKDLLVRIAVYNDKTAFSDLFKMYHARLIQFALMFVMTYKDAEDVVSEVMIKLLKQKERLPEIKNFSGYLFNAVKNQSINLNKKNRSVFYKPIEDIPKDYLTDSYIHPIQAMLDEELRCFILNTIEKLPPQRRMVYKMIKDDGIKISEVAGLLDIAEKTVKKHLELALKDLRQALEIYNAEKGSEARVVKLSRRVS